MKRSIFLGLAAFVLSVPTVQAAVTLTKKHGTLSIKGDSASDTLDIDGVPDHLGSVSVRVNLGLASTFDGIRDIKVKMGPGDDVVNVHGVNLGGDLKVGMGEGNDVFSLDNELTIAVQRSVFIGGSVLIGMGGQSADLVEFDANTSVMIGGTLRVQDAADVDFDGNGGSQVLQSSDITIGGEFVIDSPFSADVNLDGRTVEIDDVNVGSATSIQLGDGPDTVLITDSHFARKVLVKTGAGDDLLSLISGGNFNEFDDRVAATGQGGDDTVDDDPLNDHANAPTFKSFETVQ